MIKMIVTDLDGTLLRTDKTISARTRDTLAKCRKAGIKVVYATGRGGSAKLVAPAELFDGQINMNGTNAVIDCRVVYNKLIPCETARPILIACDKHGINIASETSGMHYSNFVVSDYWSYINCFEKVDFEYHTRDAEKLYVPAVTPQEVEFINGLLPDELYMVVTDDINGPFASVSHIDATKAKAVDALAKYWGINQADIVAFGDDLNDIDVLKYTGIGVAMGNAVNDVKAVADEICLTNDEDGLAVWLEGNCEF